MSGTVVNDERFQYRDGELAQVSVVTATLTTSGTIKSQGVPYTDTYIDGPGGAPQEFLRQQGGVTNRYWYVLDGQGSVVAVTDTNGKVVDRYNYDSWGEQIGRYPETVPQQLRYRGYWYDAEVEWYWLDGRYYDPEDLHWLQPDPSQQDGAHTYVYANDDPVDLIEVGGAFSISGFFHHAVEFLDSAAHVTFKVAEAAWNAVAGDDVHVICCTSYPLPIKALAALDLAITVVPGADVTKLLEVGAKTAAKAGASRRRSRWCAGSRARRTARSPPTSPTTCCATPFAPARRAAQARYATPSGPPAKPASRQGRRWRRRTGDKPSRACMWATWCRPRTRRRARSRPRRCRPSSGQLTRIAPRDILTPMVDRRGDRAPSAQVVGLCTAARAGAPLQPRAWVEVVPGVGISGDRYATRLGHWSDPRWPHQEMTLVEGEVAEELAVDAGQLRRSIVTRGVRLNDLIGLTFQLGGAQFVGVRRCDPCRYLDSLTRPGLAWIIHEHFCLISSATFSCVFILLGH